MLVDDLIVVGVSTTFSEESIRKIQKELYFDSKTNLPQRETVLQYLWVGSGRVASCVKWIRG